MEREYKNRLNLLGSLLTMIILIPILLLLNAVYIVIIAFMPSIYICILVTVVYGVIVAALISGLFRLLKVSNGYIGMLFVFAAVAVGIYFKWCFWVTFQMYYWDPAFDFASDIGLIVQDTFITLQNPADAFSAILMLNEVGTWSLENEAEAIAGLPLTVVWIAEFFIMNAPAVAACFEDRLVLIPEQNAWASPVYTPVAFEEFEEPERDALQALNFQPILDKPPLTRLNAKKTFKLAFLKVKGAATGYVAVYRFKKVRNETKEKRQGLPIFIGEKESEKLEALFKEKYAPEPADNSPQA